MVEYVNFETVSFVKQSKSPFNCFDPPLGNDVQCQSKPRANDEGCDRNSISHRSLGKSPCGSPSAPTSDVSRRVNI